MTLVTDTSYPDQADARQDPYLHDEAELDAHEARAEAMADAADMTPPVPPAQPTSVWLPSDGPFVGSRYLRGGLLVEIDSSTGAATPVTCDWLVRVASGCPEPDSIEDTYREVPCGARIRRHPDYPGRNDCTLCEAGHDRLPGHIEFAPFGPAWEREQAERFAETGSYV